MNRLDTMQPSAIRLIWCLGLYASGSTWIFNAGKKIAAAVGQDHHLESRFVTTGSELVFAPTTSVAIVKTHDVDRSADSILRATTESIWLSIRDPRDSITSLMLYQDCVFEEALQMVCDAAAFCLTAIDDPRTRLFKYEDRFFDLPESLDRIAAGFGKALGEADRQRIFSELTRPSIEALIGRFADIATVVTQPEPGHLVDLDTQWHTHHAGRDGEIGRWRRMLSGSQLTTISAQLAGFMERCDYQPWSRA